MREIKFRAWCKGNTFFDEGKPYMITQGGPDVETLQSFMFHYADEENLMQYTGLKDKTGTEIYEGDIIKCFGTIKPVVYMVGAFGYVVHENEPYAEFIPFGSNQHFDWVANKSEEVEVIGNIYENSELTNP
jgi:uncharacterized phage protein (TIGR01671 family)